MIRFPLALITGGRAAELQSLVQATLEAPLTLGPGVRVDRCKLAHATGLDKLRVASEPGWARERYRIVLAEEKSRKVRAGPGARTVEASYRQLRASSEASKAAPAANEFYYGEMEMRRAASRSERHWFEWMLLSLYKSTTGYGLRASRAFVTYVCVLLSATCLFWHANDHGWIVQNTMIAGGGGVNFDHFGEVFVKLVTRSSVSFFSPIDTAGLRSSGVVILLGLRLLAPAYLTLAILAVRARIQR